MSRVSSFFLSPRLNLPGAFVSAAAEFVSWFTTFDDVYRITPIAFMLCVYFIGMFAVREHIEAERLRVQLQPKLKVVFEPTTGEPFVDNKQLTSGNVMRIFRVGVQNFWGQREQCGRLTASA